MAILHKCDRCGAVLEGYPALQIEINHTEEIKDLCGECKLAFEAFMHPMSVLTPVSGMLNNTVYDVDGQSIVKGFGHVEES